ncbi:hypothetical protein BC940DRAFT_334434 [Gongronella butleri]|nr:hypothetical protein BC940DRAFT_334434 [Gongronella butleri]
MDPNQYGYQYPDQQQQQQQYYEQYGYDGQQGYEGYEGYDYSQYYADQGYYYDESGNYYGDASAAGAAGYDYGQAGGAVASGKKKQAQIPEGGDNAAAIGPQAPAKHNDGLTSAQRKKLAYYQLHNIEVPYHSTSGYTKQDAAAAGTSASGSNAASPAAGGKMKKDGEGKKKTVVRQAAGEAWEDPSLAEWNQNDFRLFAGDLGNEVTDEQLFKAFSKYPSLEKTRVVRDKRSGKSKGYGFVSFSDANDFVKAWREMNGKYVGNRPIKLRKSTWKDRNMENKQKKEKERTPYQKRR